MTVGLDFGPFLVGDGEGNPAHIPPFSILRISASASLRVLWELT
jgi:hypothetical protein